MRKTRQLLYTSKLIPTVDSADDVSLYIEGITDDLNRTKKL